MMTTAGAFAMVAGQSVSDGELNTITVPGLTMPKTWPLGGYHLGCDVSRGKRELDEGAEMVVRSR